MMEIIVYFACLEPCDVVSDQRKNAFLIGLFEAKALGDSLSLGKNQSPQDSTEYCWNHLFCTLSSLS